MTPATLRRRDEGPKTDALPPATGRLAGLAENRGLIGGTPDGADAFAIGELARTHGAGVVHVCRDEGRMTRLAEALALFQPDSSVILFPAWDCLPFDRVSPNAETVARRIDALGRLADDSDGRGASVHGGRIVLTTIAAVLQRVPRREVFANAVYTLTVGESLDQAGLEDFLVSNGYHRSGTVHEPGEFAVRGGLIDLFPPGADNPVRMDLFGDSIESLRAFDPMTQRSAGTFDAVVLQPVSEVVLNTDSISRFRSRYREVFQVTGDDDPLYATVSAGRRAAGMEHWLPLFHERLDTLLDYCPQALLTLDHQGGEAVAARFEQIAEHYQGRLETREAAKAEGAVYNPLPPDQLYLTADEWQALMAARGGGEMSPFAPPDADTQAVDYGGRRGPEFAEARVRRDGGLFDAVRNHLESEAEAGRKIAVAAFTAGARDRLGGLIATHAHWQVQALTHWRDIDDLPERTLGLVVLPLERGFSLAGVTLVSEQDILGERLAHAPRRRRRNDAFIEEVGTLDAGDLVVHIDHGVGRYEGLETLQVGGAPHDCLRLVYDGGDKLYLPVENIDVLTRYGREDGLVTLDRLGGAAWQARKSRVKERVREIAGQLIRLAAERLLQRGPSLQPPAGLMDEFCARFPYQETDDQERAIQDTLADLTAGRPMDRLICGDVGFGKTEVALRAAFVAAMNGVQVAVVAPTTLLARQHFATFSERFAGFPVRLAHLSRMVPAADARVTRQGLADGTIEVVIGTHALLSKTVGFKNLGLVVIDEEQHFGVRQKERLKELRSSVHVLTMTATPIPRTLQMALAGVRDMSIIATPPVDRLAVRTFVLPYDPVIVREAINRERHRGGQVFYVCPRVSDIPRVFERLASLAPDASVGVAHGQMAPGDLERVMSAFYDRRHDILLATNIIESGLDVPTANTLIVHRADMFGLAQMYQIRGRIGRSKQRAYAYFTLPTGRVLSPVAQRRLEVLHTLDSLGAGFTLASHDLDIRGAGNLLGEEQSGHIREVGVELYQHLLEEAVAEVKGEAAPTEDQWSPQIHVGMAVLIPETFVGDLPVRMGLYRRLSALQNEAEIEAFAAELIDRFGPLPDEVENLLDVVALKLRCHQAGVEKIEAGPKGAVLSFRNNSFATPDALIAYIGRNAARISLRPDQRLVFHQAWRDARSRVTGLRRLMQELSDMAETEKAATP